LKFNHYVSYWFINLVFWSDNTGWCGILFCFTSGSLMLVSIFWFWLRHLRRSVVFLICWCHCHILLRSFA
jgi:hypothetical protein